MKNSSEMITVQDDRKNFINLPRHWASWLKQNCWGWKGEWQWCRWQ